jgi:hypothetical protein
MNYSFITGLPRSGSAWIANYLSYDNVCFLHDAWKDNTPSELKERFQSYPVYAAGTADPANVMLYDKIQKEFPDAKWVVITRPETEVRKACQNLNMPLSDFTNNFQKLSKEKKPLKIPFSQLFDRADEIGRYVYEDWQCPSWRTDMLKGLNVQVHWGKVSEQFKVPSNIKEVAALTPNKMAYIDLVKEICNNDANTVRFLSQARTASEVYRALNEGKPIDVEKTKNLLESMATEWVISPFLRTFGASIVPAIVSALEKYRSEELKHCPIDTELVTAVTYIYRGNDGVKEYMPKVRELSDKILKEKT